jgi:hypothetical protein
MMALRHVYERMMFVYASATEVKAIAKSITDERAPILVVGIWSMIGCTW